MTDDLSEPITASIRRIIRAVDLHSKRLMKECGLTGPQLAVLRAARRMQPVGVRQLAGAVHLSSSTVTGILDRLEARGLVERERGQEDRRKVWIRTTEEGEAQIDAAPPSLQERFQDELARLEDWEQAMMLGGLQRIAGMMEAEDLDAAPHLHPGPLDDAPEDA